MRTSWSKDTYLWQR